MSTDAGRQAVGLCSLSWLNGSCREANWDISHRRERSYLNNRGYRLYVKRGACFIPLRTCTGAHFEHTLSAFLAMDVLQDQADHLRIYSLAVSGARSALANLGRCSIAQRPHRFGKVVLLHDGCHRGPLHTFLYMDKCFRKSTTTCRTLLPTRDPQQHRACC